MLILKYPFGNKIFSAPSMSICCIGIFSLISCQPSQSNSPKSDDHAKLGNEQPVALATSAPSGVPTIAPTVMPEPTVTPVPIPEPTVAPTVMPEPTVAPTVMPEPTVAPTVTRQRREGLSSQNEDFFQAG